MTIKLHRDLVLQLYCHFFQAERSLHRVLGSAWCELREYYHGGRLQAFDLFRVLFFKTLSDSGLFFTCPAVQLQERDLVADGSPISNEPFAFVGQRFPPPGRMGRWLFPVTDSFKSLFGRYIARWKKRWSFPAREILFLAATLDSIFHFLHSRKRPRQNHLISLRMAICDCRTYIEWRCVGLLDLQRLHRLEHFQQTEWVTPVRISDVVSDTYETSAALPRRSA